MKIAVASQNRKQVTGHTGRCRKYWIYEVADGQVTDKVLLELPWRSRSMQPRPLSRIL